MTDHEKELFIKQSINDMAYNVEDISDLGHEIGVILAKLNKDDIYLFNKGIIDGLLKEK